MALDILVTDFHDNIDKSIPLYLEDYDSIMEYIENTNDFTLIRKALLNYYGDCEIYLDELNMLNEEVLSLKDGLKSSDSKSAKSFVDSFLNLIDYALKHHRTIKFIGD
jgi:hypothetical protein